MFAPAWLSPVTAHASRLTHHRTPLTRPLFTIPFALFLSCSPPYFPGDQVKAEFIHSWNAYKQYAWGHDALRPLSKTYRDWYGVPLLMTPVDAYDTMILMGLRDEAAEAKRLILDSLSFDRDIEVQSFEITIRLLGGLLTIYEMDGDPKFLELAKDLGTRLLPVFNSATGMPYRYVHLQTGAIRDSINNPAEIGTALIEFGTLSRHTGDPVFFEKANTALSELFDRRSGIGLVGTRIDVETGEWVNTSSHVSGAIDSYYEYLLKAALLFGDEECRTMYDESMRAVHAHLADTVDGRLWYGHADMYSGKRTRTIFGALDAFLPAVLALDGDLERAENLQESAFAMWSKHGIEPEQYDYASDSVVSAGYPLRPEIVESAYYLYKFTGKERYKEMGEVILRDLIRYCRVDAGYAHLKDVRTKEKVDSMESFFLAETLKYLYLLLGPEHVLDFGSVVFNTEAHPVGRSGE